MSIDENIQVIAFAIVGLYMISGALPDLAFNITHYWGISSFVKESQELIKIKAYIVATILQLALGVYLLLGSSGLVRLIRKLRG